MLEFDFCTKSFDPRFSLSGSTAHYAPDRSFETEHLKLELDVDLDKETLKGVCSIETRKLHDFKEFRFNAVNMKIKGVKVDSKKLEFKYNSEFLTFENKQSSKDEQSVVIEYEVVKPKLGLFFIKPDKYYPKKPIQFFYCR